VYTDRQVDPLGVRQHALISLAFAGSLLAAACGPSSAPAPVTASAERGAPAAQGGAPLPFIEDDYTRALAEARRTGRPLFVDAWAPWCHSCLSFREYVLTDARLAPLRDAFVWLSIDTEREGNAAFVKKFSNDVWPTLWVIDPANERARFQWGGAPTAAELTSLLATARRDAAADAFVRANEAHAAGRRDEAIAEARRALDAAPRESVHRAQIAEALVSWLSLARAYAQCAELSVAEHVALPKGTSRATVLAVGLGCAAEAGPTSAPAVAALLGPALEAARDASGAMLADDRSGLYEEVCDALRASDAARAAEIAREWAAWLEREAASAPTPRARAVFDAHRLGAYMAMGQPLRAVTMLEASARDFPSDYNPPARLARAYLEAGKLDLARAALARAKARVYGPRAMRIAMLEADIAKAAGDHAAEERALDEALAKSAHAVLSPGQRRLREGVEKRLAALRAR
jgi:thiol-disulfide isomerase/thioredoxin